jgi:hypothetical protein
MQVKSVLPAQNGPSNDAKGSASKEGLPPMASIILSMLPEDMAAVTSRLNELTGGRFSKGIASAAAARDVNRVGMKSSLPSVEEVSNTLALGVDKASADSKAPCKASHGMGSL